MLTAVSLASASCNQTLMIHGSHGESYTLKAWGGSDRPAVLGSAAHDLNCPPDRLRLVVDPYAGSDPNGIWVVEGCGGRVSYVMGDHATLVLIGKLAIPPEIQR